MNVCAVRVLCKRVHWCLLNFAPESAFIMPRSRSMSSARADASWEAGNACIQTHGGFGFAREYDVERKFREARLYQVAPISTNLILSYVGEHILGMPRSF